MGAGETNKFAASLQELLRKCGINPRSKPIPKQQLHEIEDRLGIPVPQTLLTFATKLSTHRFARCHDRFLRPSEWHVKRNALVFAEENQGVVFWATRIEADHDDPAVVQGNPDEPRWYPESRHLSSFLLKAVCWQAVNGWMKHRHTVNLRKKDAQDRFRDLTPVCQPESRPEMDMRAFVTDGLCVCVAYHQRNALIKIGERTRRIVNDFCGAYGLEEYDGPPEFDLS